MCGIVGITARRPVAPMLLESLQRLEYRGYDSAGVAGLADGEIHCRRAVGKLERLREEVAAHPLDGFLGLGHTRWATHGAVTLANAHPHVGERVALVHNGIVENYLELRAELEAEGKGFVSESDTEVILRLMEARLAAGDAPLAAMRAVCARLRGTLSFAWLERGHAGHLFLAHQGAAMVVGRSGEDGQGRREFYAASDAFALPRRGEEFCRLREGECAVLSPDGVEIFAVAGGAGTPPAWIARRGASAGMEKGNHRHFMSKEILEQPEAVANNLRQCLDKDGKRFVFPQLPFAPAELVKLDIIACGTAYYAAMTAKYWLEEIAELPAEADISSEFRYRHSVFRPGSAALFISQSGETADTLAALRLCKERGQANVALVNAAHSSIAQECDVALPIHAGPEISVASTKAFTCMLASLAALTLYFAGRRGALSTAEEARLSAELLQVPDKMRMCLGLEDEIRRLAHSLVDARQILYIGRGVSYPLALEGALKMKEISYLDGEGYAAGELKHGPIALVDSKVAVVALAPSGPLFAKTIANIQEVAARGGRVILLTDRAGAEAAEGLAAVTLRLPEAGLLQAPLLYAIPLQLLAYHCAVMRGTDVDQPRNLAKSVTVE